MRLERGQHLPLVFLVRPDRRSGRVQPSGVDRPFGGAAAEKTCLRRVQEFPGDSPVKTATRPPLLPIPAGRVGGA